MVSGLRIMVSGFGFRVYIEGEDHDAGPDHAHEGVGLGFRDQGEDHDAGPDHADEADVRHRLPVREHLLHSASERGGGRGWGCWGRGGGGGGRGEGGK
eukprot:2835739-Rhodomonas_salina.1